MRVRKIVKSDYSLRQVCPSVRPHGTCRLPRKGISWNLGIFRKSSENLIFITDHNNGYFTWRYRCTFMIIYGSVLPTMGNVPDRSCRDYMLITNLMHWLLFIHKIIFPSTCFEPRVLIFRRMQLYTCSIWYCHTLWDCLVACRYTAVYRQATRTSHREWQYHILHVYNYILPKMSIWGSKHVEQNIILWINNQCIKLVINI